MQTLLKVSGLKTTACPDVCQCGMFSRPISALQLWHEHWCVPGAYGLVVGRYCLHCMRCVPQVAPPLGQCQCLAMCLFIDTALGVMANDVPVLLCTHASGRRNWCCLDELLSTVAWHLMQPVTICCDLGLLD